jgi:hypothetical protein
MAEFQSYIEHDRGPQNLSSPNGFEFGVVGWNWGEARPKAITFYLDGSVGVFDQHGRPIRGAVVDGKEYWFAAGSPPLLRDEPVYPQRFVTHNRRQIPCATHAEVIAALEADRHDWRKLAHAGFPQLPYEQLKKLTNLSRTPADELRKIRDQNLRVDALRLATELDQTEE